MGDTGIPGITAKRPARGGRPSRAVSAGLADVILGAAITLFLRDGYSATSMEAVAAASAVSKRTLYARFPDKAALLQAAVTKLIADWMPGFEAALEHAESLEDALLRAARQILVAALAPEALALYRLVIAEAERFPELGRVLQQAGAGGAIARIAALLRPAGIADPIWAAEQFQRLVLTGPQHRALGLGTPFSAAEVESWAQRSVALFLRGCTG
jgi:TetR/AcrR family transcriptional regulator, mexJK operon transcriptional repressor